MFKLYTIILLGSFGFLTACGGTGNDSNDANNTLSDDLKTMVVSKSGGQGLEMFIMPASDDYANIPQDPNNPITAEKVALGQMLYHETGVGTESLNARGDTYSCASCHHAGAGFKAGVPQGLGDGGDGFGTDGAGRVLATGVDQADADKQDLTSPAVLNVAYQDVMLWNGAFGKAAGSINNAVATVDNAGPSPILANTFGLSGVETQVLAGTNVHRLRFDAGSILQTNTTYQSLYLAAYPTPGDEGTLPANATTVTLPALGAAKAIAAYERTILANESPFQQWLKGDESALSEQEMRGAYLFFDKANCVACHTGPALSSDVGATADDMFFAIGFNDFDTSNPQIHGSVSVDATNGRGGFTGEAADNFKFKVPQLYNLLDTNVFGHGASFASVRDVVAYKNAAVKQKANASNIAPEFVPLGLTEAEIDDLTSFLETGLYDSNLSRYVPNALPSGNCFPVNDAQSITDLGC